MITCRDLEDTGKPIGWASADGLALKLYRRLGETPGEQFASGAALKVFPCRIDCSCRRRLRHGVAITCRGLRSAQVRLAEVQPTVGAEGMSIDSDVASGQRTDQVAPGKAFASEFVLRVYLLGEIATKSLDHEGFTKARG